MENEINELEESKKIAEKLNAESASTETNENTNKTETQTVYEESSENSKVGETWHKIIFTFLALGLVVATWAICDNIKLYGFDISQIESVGGQTLQEAYYASVGKIYEYFADFLKVLMTGISGIILCITYKK